MQQFRILVLAVLGGTIAFGQSVPPGPPYGTNPPVPIAPKEEKYERHEKKKDRDKKNRDALPRISADGLTLHHDDKQLIVHVDDGRTLTMGIDSHTQWMRSGVEMDASKVTGHTTVRVTAIVENNYDLTAETVELLKDAPVMSAETAKQAAAIQASQSKGEDADEKLLTSGQILHEPEAPDHPVLRRRQATDADVEARTAPVAAKKVSSSTDFDFTISDDSAAPPKRTFGTELLNKTVDWAGSFGHDLPNYVCSQTTTRYGQEVHGEDWTPEDVVGANIIFEDGHERYENITVDGKPTKKSMMELGGQSSTGEFGGMIVSLFNPVRDTDFTYVRTANIGDIEVAIYDFKVPMAKSDWQIIMGGQTLMPAYSGKIWVNKKTAQILRFEQHADNIPKDFPESVVETAIDYEMIPINGTKFLLPVHAENLGCLRGSTMCGKNVIEWRNYHKYEGEGTVTFQ